MTRATAHRHPVRARRPRLAALAVTGALAMGLAAAPTAHAAEPDVVSYTAGGVTEVHDATTGAVLAPGEIEVGDLIDYEIQVTNTGTVTLDGLELCLLDELLQGTAYTNLGLAPESDLTSTYLYPQEYTSGLEFSPWPSHVVTEEDLARGWVQLDAIYVYASPTRDRFAPECDGVDRPDAPGQQWVPLAQLRDLAADLEVAVDLTLQDSYPDGMGQEYEQVEITWTATNPSDSEQSVTIDSATASGNAAGPGAAFDGVTLAPGESVDHTTTFRITAAMESSGSITAGLSFDYSGDIDGLSRSTATVQADPIATSHVPGNRLELDLDVTYVDTTGDGHPSIGETATIVATVTNTGRNTVTDVALSDGADSDVAGLVSHPGQSLAARGTLTQQFTHIITAQDFERGSILVAAHVEANEVGTEETASASLNGITFAAYEDDLEPGAEGGIAVCSPGGEPLSEASPGDPIVVNPDDCSYTGASAGFRIVMASTPTVLASGTFSAAIPGDAELGAHRIALYGPNGELVGWQALDVVAPPAVQPDPGSEQDSGSDSAADELPSTGFDSWTLAAGAAALMILGAGVMIARRRLV